MTFENKRVVVIGGSSGLDLATAKATADLGARVVITARDRERLRSAEEVIGHKVRVESIVPPTKLPHARFSKNSIASIIFTFLPRRSRF